MKYLIIPVFFILFICSCGCQREKSSFDDALMKEKIEALLEEKHGISGLDELKKWCMKIRKIFINYRSYKQLAFYLGKTAEIEKDPGSRSFLWFFISDIYWQQEEKKIAEFYMLKVERDHYKIDFEYQPIGYYIAKRLITSDGSPLVKIKMYNVLLEDFADLIDVPYNLYQLSLLYKQQLKLDKSLEIMRRLIRDYYHYENLSDEIEYTSLLDELSFHRSTKYWVYTDLKMLVNGIKRAVRNRDSATLQNYVSQRAFDIKLFEKSNPGGNNWNYSELDIGKRWADGISFEDKLEDFSGENEAYLKSTNWKFRQVNTWYFYFKKLDYPYDKKFHGGWEWVGIFLGSPP